MAPDEPDRFAPLLGLIGEVNAAGLAAEKAGIVLAALESGLLERCAEPVSGASLAATTAAPEGVVAAVLDALVVLDVLERLDDDRLVVAGRWRPACSADGRRLLHDTLVMGGARARLLRHVLDGGGWTGDEPALLAVARGVTWDPATELAVQLRRRSVEHVPELSAALQGGGRYLELGCGVGGALVALVRALPGVTAVGVELVPALAAQAVSSAAALGVGDRVRVVVADAAGFRDPDAFDACFWSQFFFPTQSRAGALATALAALRPGGVLVAPAPDVRLAARPPYDDEARDNATERVLWASWGVPARTPDELVDEATAAGFVDVHLTDGAFVRTLVARAPA